MKFKLYSISVFRLWMFLLLFPVVSAFGQFKPNHLPGLKLWLRGDSLVTLNGSQVSQWNDCSGNGNDALQATSSFQPTLTPNISLLNHHPVVTFDGANDLLTGSTIANLQNSSISVFVVAKGEAQGGVLAGIFDVSSYNNGFCFGRYTYPGHGDLSIWNNNTVIESPSGTLPSAGFTYKILEGIKTYNTKTELYINGALQGSSISAALSGPFTNGNYVLGFSQGLDYFKGDIAEIIVFTSALSENDRKLVENYLSNKYAPKVNLGVDINIPFGFCSTSLDAGAGFTSYLWSTGATSQTISVSSNGTYWVSVTDMFNVASTDTIMVTYPVMHMHDTLFCAGSIVNLSPGLAGGYTYQWSNGPTTSSINVSSSGNYWVTVSDGVCSKVSDTAHVTVDNFPNEVSLGNDTSLCSGNSIHLKTPDPLPPNLVYHWSTGESASSILINTTDDYGVTVTNNNGCQAFDTIHVAIIGTAPVVNFSFTNACSGVPVMFTNNSSPSGTSWNWDFGDGQSSTSENPSHTYSTGGTYIVSLTVFSGPCSNNKTDTIIIPFSPTAGFTVGAACINTPYSFIDQSLAGLNDTIVSWIWDFGDSSPTSSLQNPQHSFTLAGNYTVSLTINTVKGCQQNITHNITVVNSAPPPQAFTLYQPNNNSTTSDHIIHFAWNQSINATSYTLEYSADSNFISNVVSVSGITNSFYQTTLSTENKYFWRVIAKGICGDNTFSSEYNFTIFSPLSTPGLIVWLKADAGVTLNGNNVLQWNDASGNGNNAVQSNGNQQPLFVSDVPLLNHYPTIRFDGVNDLLNGTTIANLQNSSISIFVVAKGESQGGVLAGLFDINSYTNGFCFGRYTYSGHGDLSIWNNSAAVESPSGTLPSNGFTYKILEGIKTYNTKTELFINGTLQNSNSNAVLCGPFTNGDFVVGYSQTLDYLKGDIAEIIVFNTSLSANERKAIEDYLNNKYAPKVNLGPDINVAFGFCDTTIDATDRFTAYQWSTGASTQTISAADNGSYSVTATNIFNTNSSDTIRVTYPAMHLHDTLVCAGNSINLSPGLGSGYSYQWSSGPTTSSINVSSAENYWVTVSDGVCSAVSNTVSVALDNFPNLVSLGSDTNSLCSGNAIYLTAPVPLPNGLLYHWSTEQITPSIQIDSSGNYGVTVTNSNGCQGKDTIHVNIIGTAPDVNFSFTSACSGFPVQFTNNSVPAGNSWLWNFGDGQTSVIENPTHIYSSGGYYIVSLTVYSGGCSSIKTDTFLIPQSPSAAFMVSTACINNPFSFIDKSVTAPNDNIVSWNWDFGDNSAISGLQNPQHIFDTAGTFVVILTIQTTNGCQQSVSHNITVVSSAPPPIPFTLYQPNNKSTTADHNIIFYWNQAINAISYTLQYSIDSTFSSGVVSISGIVNSYHQVTISNENKYFWRVIAKGICGNETYSAVFWFSIFSPLSTNGLTLWLKADAGVSQSGNKVTVWNDGSGNNYHAQQPNSNLQPSLISDVPLLNHKPAISFDGINDLLNGVTIPNLQNSSISIFVVAKGEAQGGVVAGIFDINSYSNGFSFGRYTYSGHGTLSIWNNNSLVETPAGSLPSSGFNYKMLEGIKTFGTMTDLLINTVSQISSPNIGLNDVFTNGNYDIGYATGLDYFKGNLAEVILFNTSLTDNERKSIENYLSYKYAPPVNLGPDINIAYGLCDTALNAGGRFINYLWSTGDTTQGITVAQSGIYSVTVTNIFGQLSSDTVIVTKPDVFMSDTSFCLGDTIHIAANMGTGYSYLWLPGSFSNNNLAIFDPGVYSLTVFDTSANHCSVTKTFTVTADSFAIAASLGPDKKICKGDYIGLINGAQQAVSYLWSDGSGNSLIIINDAMGSQPVYSVTVSSGNGCVAHDTIQLTVNGVNPIASFASDTVCSGNTSHFFDHSIVDPPFQITNYNWNFGDGSFSILPNPVHLFVDDGYYPVQLTITTDSGCMNSVLDTAKVFSKPRVNFLPYQGCSGVPIAFTDKTQCYIGTLTQWNWTFNDIHNVGFDTSSLQNPHYVFDSAGIYNVKLVASSNAGCMDSVSKTVTIKRSPPLDFSITTACAEHSVFFHDLIGLEAWETIISYNWQFGDGNSSVISNPNHIFDTAGIYNTEFTVKTSTGCEVSITKPIDVGGMPQVDFLYGNNCIQNTTLFTDNSLISNGNIASWHWKFGGLGSDTNQNPSFIFPDTATYNVSLAIMTDHNCVDSVSHPVKIVAAPVAEFSVSPEYGVPPLPVSMLNSSVGATTYLWTFGDSESSTLTNPLHTYQNQGIFNVLLNAFNDIGCRDTVSHKVYVLPTKVDIAVIGVHVTEDNGRITVAADLSNEGTRKIEHIDMAVDFGNGNILHEQWLGALLEGEGLHYEFAVSTDVPSNADVNFVCVEASLPDLTEDSTANNIFCVAMKDEFLMPEMYPNPVKDIINIAYILPFEDQVTINVVNSMGSFIRQIYNGNSKEGYNRLAADVSTLNSGLYSVRIYFRDKVLRKKFVKF